MLSDLILRSRALRGVSKDGPIRRGLWPSFETRPSDAPQDEVTGLGYTSPRNCDTASASTSQPNTMSASDVFSVMSWLMPPIEGMNIIAAGM